MSAETMSVFSPKLAARFDALAKKYPVKRSALVPMLLYAQDEVGYLSDAVIGEIAERIGITELDVRNVASYYSMLRFKPAGRYNVLPSRRTLTFSARMACCSQIAILSSSHSTPIQPGRGLCNVLRPVTS